MGIDEGNLQVSIDVDVMILENPHIQRSIVLTASQLSNYKMPIPLVY